MLTIAVCDDNPQFAVMLAEKLRNLCAFSLPERIDCTVLPEFGTAEEVLQYMSDGSLINILFLDIDMPHTDGFGLAKQLCDKYPETVIVFVSSYENFVFNSFEYNPFRFLRKSHLDAELPATFQKIIEKCVTDNESLIFSTTEGERIIRIRDISYFEGIKNYVYIHCKANISYRYRGTVTEAEQLTSKYDFFRIHSAFIVNKENVDYIDEKNAVVRMNTGDSLCISRRKLNEFKQSYMEFIRKRYIK